jgi:peptidoglycan/xylan/chitin deacetylase (PgdA/CDA1 family)
MIAMCVAGPLSADEKRPALRPGVVLTFDDAFVEQWLAAMPVFEKYGAHATFFVASPQKLSPRQVAGLQKLASAGHAIGCHSWLHRRAADVLKEHTVEEYVALEATPALARLRELGSSPTCYGYPSSSRTNETDAALLKEFRHLRTGGMPAHGTTLAESDEFFTKVEDMAGRGCLLGKGIDRAGEDGHPDRTFAAIFAAMERAAKQGEILVLYAHNIADGGPGHYLAPAALDAILAKAKRLGLAFHTYDDLP